MRFSLLFSFLSFSLFAQPKKVDFKTIFAAIEINPVKRNVVGNATYTFDVNDKKIDTIRIDAQKMEFTDVKINGNRVKFKNSNKQLLLYDGFKKGKNTLTFHYEAFPTQTMYFVNWDFTGENTAPEKIHGQVWTQGQGKYTSHWLPSFDDVNEKVIFSLDVTFQKSFEVISNGTLLARNNSGDNYIWQYRMKQPMSSYLVMLAIGHFEKKMTNSASGIPLYFYYEDEDKRRYEPTYRYSKDIFDFLEDEIGVKYPWEVYRQIPVRDFLYAGMENTSATVFSRDFVVDSIGFNDRNYVNVNAHELAHQWFGDMVTAQSGKDHWLQEGFATYYALLAEQKVFGDDHFYNKLFNMAQQLQSASKTDVTPLLNEKASALSFYQKGAWALHIIRSAIGKDKFNKAVKNYLEKFAFRNVTTDDFLVEIAAVSKFDTAAFKKKWLETGGFAIEDAEAVLVGQSDLMKQYVELRDHPLTVEKDRDQILRMIKSGAYFPIKELLLYQLLEKPFDIKQPILSAALKTNDLHVRQAVASSVEKIPESFRKEYETLLGDKSYETQEIALFNLWKIFPDERKRYIELSKNWVGFQDRNLKLLHLSLAYNTTEDKNEKFQIYRELLSYTGTNYDSGLQQNALEKLISLDLKIEDVLRSLAYGTGNHRWQFVKFCKDNIRILLKEKKYRDVFIKIRAELPIREKTQLQRLLEE
jgi:aminopeptidase N